MGIAIILPVLLFGINYLRNPEEALAFKAMGQLPRLFLFVCFGWWLGGKERNWMFFLILAFSGLLLATALDPDLKRHIIQLFKGRRVDFNILNEQHVALFYSIAFIGLLAFSHRAFRISRRSLRWVVFVLCLFAMVICVVAILGTQTRAAWLGLGVCLLVWIVHGTLYLFRQRHQGPIIWIATLVIVLASSSIFLFKDSISHRLASESKTLNALANGDFDNVPYTSIGIRINTWIEAIPWIMERPLTGWGGNVRSTVIDTSDRLPKQVKARFGHFHNVYIEFTLAYGLLGLAVALAPFFWCISTGWRYLHDGKLPLDLLAFTAYGSLLLAVMSTFESYLFFWSGAYVMTVLLTPIYSHLLGCRQPTASNP
ncbi:O-antigen ligase family protein [Saccharospirillum mangrovi]|nr:O-antigen ligase family protein [Saccharospirillum mangrovi]